MLDRMAQIDVPRNHASIVAGRCTVANDTLDARPTTSSHATSGPLAWAEVVVMGRREAQGSSACLSLGLSSGPFKRPPAVPLRRWTMAADPQAKGAGSHPETHAISLGG
jgi:hypothetical protein